jgi:hypothetical protein
MDTVPVKGLVPLVLVMEGDAGPELVGVVREPVPEAGVVPPPGRLPTATTAYVVSGARPVMGHLSGLAQVTLIGEPPPTGVRVTV